MRQELYESVACVCVVCVCVCECVCVCGKSYVRAWPVCVYVCVRACVRQELYESVACVCECVCLSVQSLF